MPQVGEEEEESSDGGGGGGVMRPQRSVPPDSADVDACTHLSSFFQKILHTCMHAHDVMSS